MSGMMLLPPSADVCPICATKHAAQEPHNAQSLYYQVRFRANHGRDGTWADAIAHSPARLRALWERELRDRGLWSEPADGQDVIAEPLHDAIRQVVDTGAEPVSVPLRRKEK